MTIEARVTVRNAELLVAQQGVNVASAFCFATLVPHLIGPDVYGRYTLVTSLPDLPPLITPSEVAAIWRAIGIRGSQLNSSAEGGVL
jgi:hypothetical protein